MGVRWRDEDLGLTIVFGQCSNGEYDPEPVTSVRLEMERVARAEIESAVAKTGMSRRESLRSACASAIYLTAIDSTVARWMGLSPGLF